jgi:dual specificity phosphatase 12
MSLFVTRFLLLQKFVYKSLELLDVPETNILQTFEASNQFLHTAITSGGAALVHCNAGVSRSATIVLAYLMAHHNMSLAAAHALLKQCRPAIQPNPGFMEQLRAYEKSRSSAASASAASAAAASPSATAAPSKTSQ